MSIIVCHVTYVNAQVLSEAGALTDKKIQEKWNPHDGCVSVILFPRVSSFPWFLTVIITSGCFLKLLRLLSMFMCVCMCAHMFMLSWVVLLCAYMHMPKLTEVREQFVGVGSSHCVDPRGRTKVFSLVTSPFICYAISLALADQDFKNKA